MFVYSITIMVDRRMPFASTYFNTRNHFFIASFWPSFCSICSLPAFLFRFGFFYLLSFFISFSASVWYFGVVIVFLFAHLFAAPMNLRIPNANRKKTNKKS